MELANEFARVVVELDNEGNGARLKIHSVRTGYTIYLDPLELESLTWQTHANLQRFLKAPFGPEGDEE
jgi:hypothetical protein